MTQYVTASEKEIVRREKCNSEKLGRRVTLAGCKFQLPLVTTALQNGPFVGPAALKIFSYLSKLGERKLQTKKIIQFSSHPH